MNTSITFSLQICTVYIQNILKHKNFVLSVYCFIRNDIIAIIPTDTLFGIQTKNVYNSLIPTGGVGVVATYWWRNFYKCFDRRLNAGIFSRHQYD